VFSAATAFPVNEIAAQLAAGSFWIIKNKETSKKAFKIVNMEAQGYC
jgi:hypothetical protein